MLRRCLLFYRFTETTARSVRLFIYKQTESKREGGGRRERPPGLSEGIFFQSGLQIFNLMHDHCVMNPVLVCGPG